MLTKREQQVCDGMVKGLTNKEIARKLGLSPRTVEDYRRNVMEKYSVNNTVKLVRAVYNIAD